MRTPRWFSPTLVLFPAMMGAVLALGYLSYRASSELAARTTTSVARSNRVLGQKLIERIEQVIIDTDRAFFRLVRLDDPQEFRELWQRIVRVSPSVESVIVLNDQRQVVHLVATLGPGQREAFRRVFDRQILLDMHLDTLPVDSHRHLHKSYDGRSFLLSYIRQCSEGHDYFIVLNINVGHIIHSVFSREFAELQEMNSIAVTDEGGRNIYGRIHRGPLAFEAPFPTTLYKWRLTIAPKQMGALSKDVRARSVTDLVFVLGAVAVIFLGMLVLMRAIRKERRANALKSEFIANVSHELKTPLSLIRMFGELLASGRTRDVSTADEYAAIIARESDRLTGLIDNVLDFARIERGKAAYAMVEGDLSATVERAIDLCRYRVEQAGVTLDTAISSVLRAIFDESAVTLLLLNLIENALKYGAKPGEHILVSLDMEDGAACLRVVDEGLGIAVEERKRIFERFYRGASSRTSAQRGSGIGLALVKHIAEAHGGGVKVESKLGKGAVFAVSIPVVVDPA